MKGRCSIVHGPPSRVALQSSARSNLTLLEEGDEGGIHWGFANDVTDHGILPMLNEGEVPLIAKPAPILSDSAPLLNGAPHSHLDPSSTTFGNPTLVGKTNSKDAFDHELIVKEEADEDFSNGVGSVLVNILTSMRHLPPVIHSVLLIMALTRFKKNILAAIVKGQYPGFKRQRMGTLCKKKKAKYYDRISWSRPMGRSVWGGNIPAFVLASISAFASGILAIKKLPHLSRNSYKSSGFHGFD
ncbi:Sucrose transport protein SUT4 [Acorus calamus]|uniref:Sucrose transport protein SUT4 n=1 Tax=Acorus calamus TaxID=4465 RepID=A0AAV9DMN8_ACOCL|nr:Sucrose transport protein SUT4 [Acorus calamus]